MDPEVPETALMRLAGPAPALTPRAMFEADSEEAVTKKAARKAASFDSSGLADHALAGCFTGTPFSVITVASSPDWNISRTMSQPPRNSPLT